MLRPAAPRSVAGTGPATSWLREIGATLRFGLPLSGAQVAGIAINTTDIVMIGWLGAEKLAAAVLAFNLYFVLLLFGTGLIQAVMPLAAQARGARDPRGLRRAVQQGFRIALLYCLPVWVFLWFTGSILILLGQQPAIAADAAEYMRWLQWALFPALGTMAVRAFVTAMGHTQVVLWATFGAALLNGVLDYVLIFGHFGLPRLELVGAAAASVASSAAAFGVLLLYILTDRRLRRYAVFGRIWRPDWPLFFTVIRLGWPIGATLLAEVGLFAAAAFLMGWFGPVALAAHAIVGQCAAITFMIPLGIAQAGMVRVGLAAGRGDRVGIGRAGWSAMVLGVAVMAATATLFFAVPETLMRLYLDPANPDTAAVIAFGVPLFWVGAVFQIFDGAQAVGVNILRGLNDTRVPMFYAAAGYWLVGASAAYALAFPFGLGPVGIWWGLALGLATVALLATWRFSQRDRIGLPERCTTAKKGAAAAA